MFRKFGNLAAGVMRRRTLTLVPATISGATAALPAGAAEGADLLLGTEVCRLPDSATCRPFEFDPALVRRDMTEGRPGVATLLRIQVVDSQCRPLVDARVDVWHCDACGADDPLAAEAAMLRATQFSDERGVVEFVTIFPGRVKGAATGIHFAVSLGGADAPAIAGDVVFPDVVAAFVHETATPYKHRAEEADTADGRLVATAATSDDSGEGYLAQVIVAIGGTTASTLH